MKEICIKDLLPETVQGVFVALPGDEAYKESYFEWTASALVTEFKTSNISGGTLKAWKSVPLFTQVETHIDAEMFYFLGGEAIMPFADIKNGVPDMDSVEIVRIKPGTQIIITAGKAHFVPVAEGDTPVYIVVVAPKMDAPRIPLKEAVLGIK